MDQGNCHLKPEYFLYLGMCVAPSNEICVQYMQIYIKCVKRKMHLYLLVNLPSNMEVIFGYSKQIIYLSNINLFHLY